MKRPARQAGQGSGGLGRALRYLGNQRRTASLAYGALTVATLAQLAVPQIVQNMIDAATAGFVPGGDPAQGEQLVINAALLILLFAVLRGVFSFVQAFMAETTSQGLAFDLRNAIFAKIQ